MMGLDSGARRHSQRRMLLLECLSIVALVFVFGSLFFFAKVSVSLFPPFASVGDLSPACHGNCFHLFWKKKTNTCVW